MIRHMLRCGVALLALADVSGAVAQGYGQPSQFQPAQGGGMKPQGDDTPFPNQPPRRPLPQATQGPPPGFGASPGFGPPPRQNGQPARPNLADELTDFGVPPQTELQDNVGSETPLTIPGGHVITTTEMRQAVGTNVVFVDVWDAKQHPSLPGALLMPGAGSGGSFDDETQQRLWDALAKATNRQPDRPIVFFCTGSRCWESYNAALRAINMGFKTVLWYRGGLAAWQAGQAAGPVSQAPSGPPQRQGRIGFGP